ncbi:Arginase/deacetylase [Hesseltinella vesiculosa]|uniref:histone deacetylase n=1 Tax=Hesseltinella vesiculosa TaxID=101127 RepID=A0A1X2GQC7_9FUNG|nr:Arginase/deacetylase [Hesseltinella vesiculosa]
MPREDLLELESISDSIYVNNQTYEASLYAAGGVVQVCRAVVLDEVKNGFAIVRPPGHHAEPSTFMGFCFLNNVAIAASYCRRELGVKRIMIVDWDIHFGNGTYNIFERDADVLYLSLHRYEEEAEFYPNDTNGCIESIGEGGGTGRKVNIAWSRAGVRDADYLHAFHEVVMPIGYEFNPELVIVSAGFDAADGDEIGMCHVTPEGYSQMTHLLTGLANGRLVMALEGGYNLEATASSAVACMQVLAGEPPRPLKNTTPSISAVKTVADVKNVQKAFWSSLA